MVAAGYRFRAEMRARWRSVLALALLAGLAGGLTLTAIAVARRQVSASVAWQATTLGTASLLIGVPVGVILGRWAWTALAENLGTVADPIVPVVAVMSAIPLVLLVAKAVAFAPGRIAARTRPAAVLRSE